VLWTFLILLPALIAQRIKSSLLASDGAAAP